MKNSVRFVVLTIVLLLAFNAMAGRAGKVGKNLGVQGNGFGSSNQAQVILQLISEKPDKIDYQILYNTHRDVVIFGCNFDKNIIMRMHDHKNSHGTVVRWGGYVLDRLRNAAGGGSLNDTQEGKLPGSYEKF